MHRHILCLFSLLLALPSIANSNVVAKAVYQNTHYHYQVPYSKHWKMLKNNPNANVSVFLCSGTECHSDSQFIVSARIDKSLKNLDNRYFIKHLNEHNVRRLLYNMIDRVGKIKKLYFIRQDKVGNLRGYRAKALVRFQLGGVTKVLYYALTFNHGHFYNLQFFAIDSHFDKDFVLGQRFFDEFIVNAKIT